METTTMTQAEIRTQLAEAHAVHGVPAKVQKIRTGSLAGGWQYKKFKPGMMFVRQPWLYAGTEKEVIRFLS